LMGRLQRYVNDVKADINREMELEELRKFKSEFEQTAQTVQSQLNSELSKTEEMFNTITADLAPHDEAAKPPVSPETGPGLESGQITESPGTNRLAAAEQKSTV